MKRITITDAKALATKAGAHGVVVLAFLPDGRFQGVSYGATKEKCANLGEWLDLICDRLGDGTLRSPDL